MVHSRLWRMLVLGCCVWGMPGGLWASSATPTSSEDSWEFVEDKQLLALKQELANLKEQRASYSGIWGYIFSPPQGLDERIERLEAEIRKRVAAAAQQRQVEAPKMQADAAPKTAQDEVKKADDEKQEAVRKEQVESKIRRKEERKRREEAKNKKAYDELNERYDLVFAMAYEAFGLAPRTPLTPEVWRWIQRKYGKLLSEMKKDSDRGRLEGHFHTLSLLHAAEAGRAKDGPAQQERARARREEEAGGAAERRQRAQAEASRRQRAQADMIQKRKQEIADACKTLGITWSADLSKEAVNKAFKGLALKWHPDKWKESLGVDKNAGNDIYIKIMAATALVIDAIEARDKKKEEKS